MMTSILIGAAIAALGGYAFWRRRIAQYTPPMPGTHRIDILYGYFGRDLAQCDATHDTVNLAVEMRWDSVQETIARMQRQPCKTLLCVSTECWINNNTPRPQAEAEALLRQTLDALRDAGVIGQVIGFYPLDEPDLWHASDADVSAVCATLRRVAASYPGLGGCTLACCYANTGQFPGAGAMDWLAVDDYPAGSNALIGAAMTGLRQTLKPGQRLFLIPGGADPFKNNPEAFRRVAHADPLVVAVVPFLWRDYNDPSGKPQRGIGSNGMAATYTALGLDLTQPRGE